MLPDAPWCAAGMATTPTPPLTSNAGAAARGAASFPLMLGVLWRLSKGYRLCPWGSPFLRGGIWTYSGLHAEHIGARDFWRFSWTNRRELLRFLAWAERMESHK